MLSLLRTLFAPKPAAIDARTKRLIERAAENERQRKAYADRRVREIRQARANFLGEMR